MLARQLSRALVVVGALNWGLTGLARLDLVAALTGTSFGKPNTLTRLIYTAVGAAAVVETAAAVKELNDR